MTFDKYEKQGDYHWKCWEQKDSAYSRHALFCGIWVAERPCLDVGCGDGLITSLIGRGTLGIDSSELAVSLARNHGVNARVGSVYELEGFEDYRAVFFGDVIEHLEDPHEALQQIWKVLMPGGFLYVSTPPKQPTLSPYHVREYTKDELKTVVESAGFVLEVGVLEIPEWVQMYGKFKKP